MTHEIAGSLPFTTGDDVTGGYVTYRLRFIDQMWMLEAIMAALIFLTEGDNWNDVGTVSREDAASMSSVMVEIFDPVLSSPGIIYPFGGSTLPDGALWCDGASYLRADYPDLFGVIGSTFGSADSDHFNVPDLRYRVPAGVGSWSGSPDLDLGDQVGEPDHTLTTSEMPSHQHSIDGFVPALVLAPGELPSFSDVAVPSGTGFTGGGDPHNNMQPTLGVNYIISTV